jgi:hypothetical protein
MNGTNRRARNAGFACCGVLLGVLTGCTLYQEQPGYGGAYYGPSGQAEVSYAEIRNESDFYEPLSPYGRWEVIGSYGQCWIPGGVEAGWSPYSSGYWQQTDYGWYWASDEPWGWATYHYGRWDSSPQHGWFWVPQTQWAPAWVSWREGGGYVGWAPLGPGMRAGERGGPSHGYVFVDERRFLEPVRSRREPVDNNYFDRTVEITRTRTVNRTAVYEGPGVGAIEQASGRRIQATPVRELRSKDEPKVATGHRTPTPTHPQNIQGPSRNEAQPSEKKVLPVYEPRQGEKPGTKPAWNKEGHSGEQSGVSKPADGKRVQPQAEGPKIAPTPPPNNSRPDVARGAVNHGQNQPKDAEKHPEQLTKRSGESNQKAPAVSEQHAKPEQAASDQNRTGAAKEDRKQREEN